MGGGGDGEQEVETFRSDVEDTWSDESACVRSGRERPFDELVVCEGGAGGACGHRSFARACVVAGRIGIDSAPSLQDEKARAYCFLGDGGEGSRSSGRLRRRRRLMYPTYLKLGPCHFLAVSSLWLKFSTGAHVVIGFSCVLSGL